MSNLHDGLDTIAGPAVPPSPAQIDADLARGKRALRRRRAVQQVGASVFAVAAIAAAVTYGTRAEPAAPAPEAVAPVAPVTSVAPQTVATKLVSYKGEQPKGFTIDKVPDGWEVQGVNAGALTIAPIGIKDQHPDSFVGKIAVMLQSADDKSTPTGQQVTVGGKPGVISKPDGGGHTKTLWVRQPNGIWLQVQIWDARGWTPGSMVEFADGITVTKDAEQGRG